MSGGKEERPRFKLDLSGVANAGNVFSNTHRTNTSRSNTSRSPGKNILAPKIGPPRTTPRNIAAAVNLATQKASSPRSLTARNLQVPSDGPSTAISIGYSSKNPDERRQYPWVLIRSSEQQTVAAAEGSLTGLQQNSDSFWASDYSTAADQQPAAVASPRGRLRNMDNGHSNKEFSSLGGKMWSFGPPEGLAKGKERRRSREGNVYISAQHTRVDPGTFAASQIPGAGAYSIDGKLDLLSTHQSGGTPRFVGASSKSSSNPKLYISPEHAKADPSLNFSPGPGTATPNLWGSISAAASSRSPLASPRFGPAPSPRAKQPFISRQHNAGAAGQESPGPAAYDSVAAAAALGDHRTVHFGTDKRAVAGYVEKVRGPGPGSYVINESTISTRHASPSFSLGAAIHQSPSRMAAGPAPGSYDIGAADKQRYVNSGQFSIQGKLERGGAVPRNDNPGPAHYTPMGPAEGMGYEADLEWARRWLPKSRALVNSDIANAQE